MVSASVPKYRNIMGGGDELAGWSEGHWSPGQHSLAEYVGVEPGLA